MLQGLLAAALAGVTISSSAWADAAAHAPLPGGGVRAAHVRWGAGGCRLASPQVAHCTTGGEGEPLLVAAEHFDTPHDLRGRFVSVWVRVDRLAHLAGLELRLSSDDLREHFFGFEVPLYADPAFSLLHPAAWVRLSFSFGGARVVGSPDRSAVDAAGWFVRDAGRGTVELRWARLGSHPVAGDGRLSLTFDDGLAAHRAVAAEEMHRYGFSGTAYVMPEQLGGRGFLSLAQLVELRDRYGWEIAAHHDVPLTELARGEVEPTLAGVQRFLTAHGLGPGAQHLAFPLGRQSPALMPLVRERFRTARLASAGPETIPPADPHRLRVLNVLDTTPPRAIGAAARRAREHGEWLILMFHHLVPRASAPLEYGIRDFVRALEQIRDSGIPVRTVGEAWEEMASSSAAQPASRPPER